MKFVSKVKERFGNEYEVLEKKEHRTYLVRHNKCGGEESFLDTKFFSREIPCKDCHKEQKLLDFVTPLQEIVDKLYDGEYTVLLQAKVASRIALEHKVCRTKMYKFQHDIIKGRVSCKTCYQVEESTELKSQQEKLQDSFYKKVEKFDNPTGYTFLGVNGNMVKFSHEACGNESEINSVKFFNYLKECPHCYEVGKLRKKTSKKFPDYTFVSENKVVHNECGREIPYSYEISATKNNSNLCADCHNEKKRKVWEEKQKQKIWDLTNGEYEMISEYKNSYVHITVRHNMDCKHEFDVTLNDFVTKGTRCPVCNGFKVTEDMFMDRFSKFGSEYELATPYVAMSKELTIFHKTCGEHTTNEAKAIVSANEPCNYCGNRIKDIETANRKIKRITQDEYEIVEFSSMSEDATFLHHKCGHKYPKKPSVFINSGHRCPKCFGRDKTKEEMQEIVTNCVGAEYKFVGQPKNMRTETDIRHEYCGCVFKVKPQLYQTVGKKCPSCYHDSHLNGKLTVNKLDKLLGVETARGYEITAENGFKMTFPYAFFKDGELLGVIDIRKEQHVEPKEEWGGEAFFRQLKGIDSFKENYCAEKQLPLLIITPEVDSYNSLVYRFLKQIAK